MLAGVALVSPKTRHQGHSFSSLHKKTLSFLIVFLSGIHFKSHVMRRYYISCPCEDKNLSKPDQIVDLPSPRTKSKQKQTPFQDNLGNLLLISSVYSYLRQYCGILPFMHSYLCFYLCLQFGALSTLRESRFKHAFNAHSS